MEANNRMLYDDIIKKVDVQYTIPVYQRNYTWEKEHCDKLFDDILNSIKLERNHFLGSLVYSKPSKRSDIKCCPIIDGQQRLTTVMLLLKAIEESITDKDDPIKKKIISNLYNRDDYEERYKLKLKNTDNDNTELENILMGKKIKVDNSSKIVINYNHFKRRVKKAIEQDGYSYKDLLDGIEMLEIVEIVLEEDDAPQKIFESINSTGVKLTTADLIRNFLLMGITSPGIQTDMYKNYWVSLEDLITKDNIEKFFYNFLVSKDRRYIEESKVYNNFKEYYMNKQIDSVEGIEEIFKEIIRYAKYYKLLVCNDSTDYSEESNELCKMFNLLQHRTIYPFLLSVCKDFDIILNKYDDEVEVTADELKIIEEKEEEFNKILKLFGNYALRRNITDVQSSSLRKFYSSLHSRVFSKNKSNYDVYYKALESYICTLKTEDVMPSDSDFRDGLYYKNMYVNTKTKILRYFFDIIENDNKEPVDMSSLTIEHILPETLNADWINSLGENHIEIHDKYAHTLGNLSITGYNSEFSNFAYSKKKEKFLENINEGKSKIITLNQELMDDEITTWGEEQILDRAKRLSDIIIGKFPYPTDVDTNLEFEEYFEFYIDNPDDDGDTYFSSSAYKLYGFQFEGTKHNAKNSKTVYKELIKVLYQLDSSILDEMAEQKVTYTYGSLALFSKTLDNDYQEEVLPGLFVRTHFNRPSIFEQIRELFKKYQLNILDFSLLFIEIED